MKCIFCISALLLSLHINASNPINNTLVLQQQTPTTGDITATISKNTTEKQFEELIAYFKKNGITVDINEIKYNSENEITGIQIQLDKDGQQSSYSMNTNIPIEEVELGYKNGQLFVSSKGNQFNFDGGDLSAMMQQFQNQGMGSFDLNSFFNDENTQDQLGNLSQFFRGSFGNLDEMMEQMRKQFSHSQIPQTVTPNTKNLQGGLPKYSFINKPDLDKLIIIDGKESDFETLDNLAKNNQLDTVESLKPVTAMSIYGDKAKDGAVIATTIKK